MVVTPKEQATMKGTKRSSKDEPQISPSGFVVGAWVDEGIRGLRIDEIRPWSLARRDLTRLAKQPTLTPRSP